MKKKLNYLLGFGERLTEPISKPSGGGAKNHPYTFGETKKRLIRQIEKTIEDFSVLPELSCPNDEAVALVTIHPTYLAKSYYPKDLFNTVGLTPIGSKQKVVSPDKWGTKKHPESAITSEFFVSGSKELFRTFAHNLVNWAENSIVADDLRKVESFHAPENRAKKLVSDTEFPLLEVVLHAKASKESDYILDGFREYLSTFDIKVDLNKRLHSGGLCFLPVRAPKDLIVSIEKFSFLRVIREMPRLRQFRPFNRTVSSARMKVELPDEPPLDPTISVAVFDGGLPPNPNLGKWVRYKEPTNLGSSVDVCENHGLGVTSSLLFGQLEHKKVPNRPFAYVDHYRVIDTDTENDSQGELLSVLQRIRDVLQNKKYSFINLSIGPDLPIEDDDVHAWTAVLDPLLSDGQTLATIAVGNSGENDWNSGNARIQAPADCVNGLSIGSCDSHNNGWKRASYSSIGPGRSPGIIKPDALAFGGSHQEPFWFLDRDNPITSISNMGTSYAAPNALRNAIGIRAILGSTMTPLSTKALLLHRCESHGHSTEEVGRGRILNNFEDLISCEDNTAHIIYQGELAPAQWIRAQIPLPSETLLGFIEIGATICFATEIDPQDTVNYTRSGLDIIFRPHSGKRSPGALNAKSKKLFSSTLSEINVRQDAHKWETTMTAFTKLRGSSLKDPVLDIHYNARTSGGPALNPKNIPYALIVTVRSPKTFNLYDKLVQRYRTQLEILQPLIEIPVRV